MLPIPLFPTFQSIGSFFIGLVSGRNTDKTISNNKTLEEARITTQKELAKLQREAQLEINRESLAFQRERLQREQMLQLHLSELNYQRQLEIANVHRNAQLALPETQKLFENWPLRIVPEQILSAYQNRNVPPLRVFLSPPSVDFDKFINPNPAIVQSATPANFPKIERRLANALHDVFNTHYSQDSTIRPMELLDGAWDSSRYCGGASLLALFSKLQSTPVLILDTEVVADNLTLWVSYWGIGQTSYKRQKVLSNLPYRDILDEFAKSRALKWKRDVKDVLLAKGEKAEDIDKKYGGDNVVNLTILEDEETDRRRGIYEKRHYQFNQSDWENLCQVLGIYHILVAGVIADGHFLLHHHTTLFFHSLLPELLEKHEENHLVHIIDWMLTCYDDLFKALSVECSSQVANLRIQLANSLAKLKDKRWAKQELAKSLTDWLQRRGISCKDLSINSLLSNIFTLQPALFVGGEDFLVVLDNTLQLLGLMDESKQVAHLISLATSQPKIGNNVAVTRDKQAPLYDPKKVLWK
ncbi:MAG: hypothetical protein BWK78_02005 [Thiotrichaceae bacterium IS1]|nr:MAG: hypothetical protein BWK78_02005 [Thiotrichaceae bacterium IS1]